MQLRILKRKDIAREVVERILGPILTEENIDEMRRRLIIVQEE